MIPARVDPLLRDLHEHLTGAAVVVLPHGHVALAVSDPEREGVRLAPAGQALTQGLLYDDGLALQRGLELGDLGGEFLVVGFGTAVVLTVLLRRGQRLGDLAVVAVDRDGLQAQTPRVDVELLDVLDRRLLRHVDGLGDRPADERLDGRHHLNVSAVMDGEIPHGAGEHGHVLGPQIRRAHDRVVLIDVGDDLSDLALRVAQPVQRAGHGLVDDAHRPATHELLRLDQAEVGLDTRRVAVHEEADGPGRGEHGRLRVAHTVDLTELHRRVP
jgi:hypothetical protein